MKDPNLRTSFKTAVLSGIKPIEGVQAWWRENGELLRKAGEQVLGKTSGKQTQGDKDTWWWNVEVQAPIKAKKDAKKSWDKDRTDENRKCYKQAKKEAKRAVGRAKAEAWNEVYEELKTTKGERKLFRIANMRDKASKDLTHVRQIKNEQGVVLREETDIKERWRGYFKNLLNEENPRLIFEDGNPRQSVTMGISRVEVKLALMRMKDGKATGPDEIPVEAWKCLGEEGIDILWDLMQQIYAEEKVPNEWRDSVIVPIYKEKGDIQDCGNYRGIKLMSHSIKVWERIIETRLRNETEIGEEQFGFMPGKLRDN